MFSDWMYWFKVAKQTFTPKITEMFSKFWKNVGKIIARQNTNRTLFVGILPLDQFQYYIDKNPPWSIIR